MQFGKTFDLEPFTVVLDESIAVDSDFCGMSFGFGFANLFIKTVTNLRIVAVLYTLSPQATKFNSNESRPKLSTTQ